MAKLLYMGRNSFRIIGARGTVVYVDPFAGDDYDIPADLILVTHQHHDHNMIEKVAKKNECLIIQNYEALEGGTHNNFDYKNIYVQSVEANNKNHPRTECVGFIVTIEGISSMRSCLATVSITWATRKLRTAQRSLEPSTTYPCIHRLKRTTA